MLSGGKDHELRGASIKRIKETDNQHFIQLEADKCQSNQTTSFDGSTNATEFDYSRSLKEHRTYFGDHPTNRLRSCDPYSVGVDKLNSSHESIVSIGGYDDSTPMNGDNGSALSRGTKRRHTNDKISIDDDNSEEATAKAYKNNCNDGMLSNRFDYVGNFDVNGGSIRARNFDEMQSDEHQRLIDTNNSEYRDAGGSGAMTDDGRCGATAGAIAVDDNNGNHINVNYASSDDLNQTNTSEHDDKNLSGSDDESGGK